MPPPTKPNQVWITDITCIPTREGWLFLAAEMDLFSRNVRGWAAHGNMETDLDIEALDHLVKGHNVNGSLFHDVGQSYLNGRFSPVVNGVGVGLGIDVALFSFLERANLRVDLAQPLLPGRGPVIWFGLNQVF